MSCKDHVGMPFDKIILGGESIKYVYFQYTLGFQSPNLRMGAWNLNTLRFVSVIIHPLLII